MIFLLNNHKNFKIMLGFITGKKSKTYTGPSKEVDAEKITKEWEGRGFIVSSEINTNGDIKVSRTLPKKQKK